MTWKSLYCISYLMSAFTGAYAVVFDCLVTKQSVLAPR